MKTKRQSKIIELIQKNDIETQEELTAFLDREGFRVTQATVSRDIRELKLTKISLSNGKQKYAVLNDASRDLSEKYHRVFRDGLISMDVAQNILVIKTVSGMASAVCAAIDAIQPQELLGSIAGDDTILCVIRTVDDAERFVTRIKKIVQK